MLATDLHVPLPSDEFADAVCDGLARRPKTLPCRFFYDARGSELFEAITRTPEYYPTRAEAALLQACAPQIAAGIAPGTVLVEFGSGSSTKTEILLAEAPHLAAYVPIDVSESALAEAHARLAQRFPDLPMTPVTADFTKIVRIPAPWSLNDKVGFFPGSTIGNFAPGEAVRLLKTFRGTLVPDGRLIVGVDLKKSRDMLEAAYNDAAGITAEFNRNLLARINRELGGTFALDAFDHRAHYNVRAGRIEMHLVSTRDQEVKVAGRSFKFQAGESIHTENSYKYSVEEFRALALQAGWRVVRSHTDADKLFSVHELITL